MWWLVLIGFLGLVVTWSIKNLSDGLTYWRTRRESDLYARRAVDALIIGDASRANWYARKSRDAHDRALDILVKM